MFPRIFQFAAFAVCVLAIAACADSSPPPAAANALAALTPTAAPTNTPPPAPTAKPTHTPSPAATPTHTPTPSPTATPTHTPTPTAAPTAAPIAPHTPHYEYEESFPPGFRPSQIEVGDGYICGLDEDGRAVCIEGVADMREEVYQSAEFSSISSGRFHVCGLGDGGEISCWGSDEFGESVPPGGAFSSLAAGKRHNCALRAGGDAVCWGWDKDGRATPPPDARFIAIAAGGAHSCGIAEFGNLICWGADGGGRSESREGPFTTIALGDAHTCALRPGGAALCQGNDDYGQSSPPPVAFSRIAAGEKQSCGITPGGELKCWGLLTISDHPDKFAAVSAGYRKVCALSVEGVVRCWLNSPSVGDPLGGAWLEYPIEMFPLPDGGVAVADLQGYIEIYPPDGGAPRIALDLTERTNCCYDDRGMLSAALDPDFDRFPFIYIYWQTNEGVVDADNDPFEARVSRFPMTDDGEIDADGELVILRLRQRRDIHFGGAIRFGADGMLYLGLGDLAEIGDRSAYKMDENHPSQNLSILAGKIIRIDIRGASEGEPYRIPPDNPFLDTPGARPEIWAQGLRNPWRMSFAQNGELLVADAGWHAREEVSIAARGANLGWPIFEGGLCNAEDARLCDDSAGYTFPIYEYPHGDGDCAIMGGMNARGGEYIFGDYCSGRIWALERTAPDVWSATEILGVSNPIIAFGSDANGAVYALRALSPVSKASE